MVKDTISSPLVSPSTGDIARRAYSIYIERGRTDGFDCEDWLRAERELAPTPTVAPARASTRRGKTPKDRPL